jgi:hypothetical protein
MTETPDNWVIVDMGGVRKILCGWVGGYLGGDQWRLSSGVVHIVDFGDRYDIANVSGSLYVCYKKRQGCSSYMTEKINSWRKTFGDQLNLKIITLPSPDVLILNHKEIDNEVHD